MFATFLTGTVLASLAALTALLAAPRPVGGGPATRQELPWNVLTVAVLLAVLAFLGGLAMGA